MQKEIIILDRGQNITPDRNKYIIFASVTFFRTYIENILEHYYRTINDGIFKGQVSSDELVCYSVLFKNIYISIYNTTCSLKRKFILAKHANTENHV